MFFNSYNILGCRAGIFTLLERRWNHKCEWVCCQLHIAELILRKLIEELDGVTLSPDKYSGENIFSFPSVMKVQNSFNPCFCVMKC